MKVKRIIFLFLIILICTKNVVHGNHVTDLDIEFYVKNSRVFINDPSKTSAEYENELLNNLKNYLGYSQDEKAINKKMKFDTSIKIIKRGKNDEYTIQLGSDDGNITISGVKKDDLQKIYGCPDPTSDTPWKVVLIVSSYTESGISNADGTIVSTDYKFKINEIYNSYNTDDYSEGQNLVIESENLDSGSTAGDFVQGAKDLYNTVKSYNEFMKKFGEDQGAEISKRISNFFRDLADIAQTLINKSQTVLDEIPFSDYSLVYNYSDLTAEGTTSSNTSESEEQVNYSVLNKYTQVGNPGSTSENNQKYTINIDNKIDKFSSKTKIPVIPVDIYGLAFEKIDIFDVDFLQIYHKENKIPLWNKMRDIFSTITHLVLYISTAILLSTLIYHGINIIRSVNDNPASRATHIQGLHRFATSLIILVVVVLFMALCTTFSNFLMQIIKGNEITQNDELPIRVNVDNVYSFSTNVTGYFRFMSESEDTDTCNTNTLNYCIIVIINVVVFLIMIYRSIKMWILGMIGPIVAATNALNIQEQVGFKITLKDWAKNYALLVGVQIVITIVYSIIEYTLLTN